MNSFKCDAQSQNDHYSNFCHLCHRVKYFEIYNETVTDLITGLKDEKTSEQIVNDKSEIIKIIDKGNNNRTTAETNMNEKSSRSHAVLQIVSNKFRLVFSLQFHQIK